MPRKKEKKLDDILEADPLISRFRLKKLTKTDLKKRDEARLKMLRTILTTFLLAKEKLETNKFPAMRKRNVSIATKTAEEIMKQNGINGKTWEEIFIS